jgi:hypothetical protein
MEMMVAVFALASLGAGVTTEVGFSIEVESGGVGEGEYDDEVRPSS